LKILPKSLLVFLRKIKLVGTLTILFVLTCPINSYAAGNGEPPPASHLFMSYTTFRAVADVLPFVGIVMGLLGLLMAYLQGSVKKDIERRKLLIENRELQARLDIARVYAEAGPLDALTESPEVLLPNGLTYARAYLKDAREGLKQELFKVERRASLNLSIGIIISLAAIFIFAMQLWEKPPTNAQWIDLFALHFPRLAACVFIELLAFFFLRLYRASLDELGNYGRELKEITMKQVSLEAAWDELNRKSPRARLAEEFSRPVTIKSPITKKEFVLEPDMAFELIQKLTKIILKKDKSPED
jgi:hypothetical protein